jgi:hypothetical protein
MNRRHTLVAISLLVLATTGCGGGPGLPEGPAASGRRIQNVTLAAGGAVPYQVSAHELVFDEQIGVPQTRRAAPVVDLFGDRGRVEGFAEWGRPGDQPTMDAVGGRASRRGADGRVVVDEASGDVTLTSRQ